MRYVSAFLFVLPFLLAKEERGETDLDARVSIFLSFPFAFHSSSKSMREDRGATKLLLSTQFKVSFPLGQQNSHRSSPKAELSDLPLPFFPLLLTLQQSSTRLLDLLPSPLLSRSNVVSTRP